MSWPLMNNNITREDLDVLIEFLKQDDAILTQNKNVRAFEQEWSEWLGVKHSVFVNSGSSANLITMAAVRQLYGPGEVIVPTLTWVSDIASVLQNGFQPVFADIDPHHLGMDTEQVIRKMNGRTRAVFLTHVLGFNALDDRLIEECKRRNILLIEDACEAHGATHHNQKLGSIGFASNFSFYFAHHMSTIEGGMVSTNDERFYETLRMLRSHGLVREMDSETHKNEWIQNTPNCNPEFLFAHPGYNVRSTELNAVLGRNQLKRLDANTQKRTENFNFFLSQLDPAMYRTDFRLEGCSNYAFIAILKSKELAEPLMAKLRELKIEFRRGLSGGGNQLRQPYLKGHVDPQSYKRFPNVEYVHDCGFYIGNYPGLTPAQIRELCGILNGVG